MISLQPPEGIALQVREALAEDIGDGDLTARLVDADQVFNATLISREPAIVCGGPWITAVFKQLDPSIEIEFLLQDSDRIEAMQTWCTLKGPARALLTGERTALNFAQTLAGTATATQIMVDEIANTRAQLLDTRKTLPGLRAAQKYAVRCGGGMNHRIGLYDGILVKENHIRAAGSIENAINLALKNTKGVALVEIEVENLSEFSQALNAGAKRILLDNFSTAELKKAVGLNNGQAELEASGNVNRQTIRAIADTGVNFISCGQITKDIKAIDLSLQFST